MTSIKLVFGLRKHPLFDFEIIPYLMQKKENKAFFSLISRLNKTDLIKFPFLDEDWIITILNYTDKLSYSYLNKTYNKKHLKTPFNEFYYGLVDREKKVIRYKICFFKDIIVKELLPKEPLFFIMEDLQKRNYFEKELISVSDKKLDVKFIFSRQKNESKVFYKYRLKVFLEDMLVPLNDAIVLNDKKPVLIYKNKAYLFKNKSFNGNKLKPFITKKEIVIPSRLEKIYFNKFVKYAVNKFAYSLDGFDIIYPKFKILPILDIENTINRKIIFSLSFKYLDQKIPFYYLNKIFTKIIEKKDQFFIEQMHRNLKIESQYIKALCILGFKKNDKYFILDEEMTNIYIVLKKHASKFNRLKGIGFKINNRLLKKESVFEKEKIISKVTLNRDWFDINIHIKIKEFTIPFMAFRNHILEKKPEFYLPDKTIFIIPTEWFSELSELAKRVNNNNQIKIAKQNYKLLDESGIILLDDKLKQRIKNLENIKNITVPNTIKAKLRDYQIYGYRWLYSRIINNFGVCLADDMGLGKTLQVITLLERYFKEFDKTQIKSVTGQLDLFSSNDTVETALLVLPRVLIHNWKTELQKFAPELTFFLYYGNDRKKIFLNNKDKKHLAITSYGVLRNDIEFLKEQSFSFLILDESHVIKNPKSLIFKSVIQIVATHKISITGTPFENKLTDIWAQFYFLNSHLLGSFSFFKKEYVQKIKNNPNAIEVKNLKKIISPFILRRLKNDVAKELPKKNEQNFICEMDVEQKSFYNKEKSIVRNEILKLGHSKNKITILAAITRLRQIALHPKLVEANFTSDSSKFLEIISFAETLITQKHKFIIFSSYVRFLELFKEYFIKKNISFKMLTGKSKNPQSIVKEYEDNNSIFPFLISIKAGGVGLNITAANYVLISDPWWNPFVEKQAVDRTHRIGQTKNVFVYKFISKDSIEEKILTIQKEKSNLSDILLNEQTIDLNENTLDYLFT